MLKHLPLDLPKNKDYGLIRKNDYYMLIIYCKCYTTLLYSRFFKHLVIIIKNLILLLKDYLLKELCHETYKDKDNNWVSPDEIELVGKQYQKKNEPENKIKVGTS